MRLRLDERGQTFQHFIAPVGHLLQLLLGNLVLGVFLGHILLALFNPLMKALKETAYQMQRPYILDDSAARKAFGMQPTEWKRILKEVVAETRSGL